MSANFTPDMVGYKGLSPFRFWCQKTLPLVYDDSLSYYELLCKVVSYINNLITDVAATEENVDRLLTAYNQLQEYVNDYFDGTDFQQKIDDSLDRYAEDGTLSAMVNTHVRALLPYEVGQQIGDVVDEQLPPVVDLKLAGVVDAKLPDVVDDKLEDVVRPMIVPAVSGLLPQEVGRQLPDEVETQLPGVIGEDLQTIAPPVIQQWLNDHPDATTSVEDGSISLVKLNTVLQRLARLDGNFYPTEYDPTVTYYTDDMCTYKNTVTDVEMAYKCIATSTTGTFSAADWAVVDEYDIVINARAIYDLASSIAPVYRYPNNPAIPTGTIFFYRGNARNAPYGLWRATTDIPAATFVTPSYAERVTILDLIDGIDQLETDVADLKSAINLIEITNQTPGLTVEKQKYVNRTTGAIESNTSRSPNAVSGIQVEGDAFVFKIASCEVAGVRGIAFYDGNGDFIPNSGKAYTIGETTYFFTIPAEAVTMAVTTFGVDNVFSIRFVYFQNTDKTLTESDVPADAAITGDEIQAVKSIAESNASLIRSVLTTNTTTYNDTPDRGISGQNSGFILSDPNDVCTIKITPTFSSETNPYTPVFSGTFTVRLYRISRENDTITLVEQIGDDTSYSIGDEVTVNGFDGTMLFDIRNAIDSNNNIVKVGYIYSGKSWGNTLVSFTNTATTATTFAEFGIGGTCTIIKASIKGKISSVLDGKRITVIGDSITEKNYRAVTNWPLWIEDWTGAVVQNLGISGSGFIRTSPYKNRISQIDTPDIIGVAMTWNDLLSGVNKEIGTADDVITEDDTIAAWVNEFFDLLITAYPTTPIIAYCQSPWAAFNPNVEISNQYISVMTELLAKKGIPYYKDLYYGCVLRPWLDANKNVYYKVDTESSAHYGETDGIHPNSEGHKVIARYLYPRFAENIVSTGLDYVLNAL